MVEAVSAAKIAREKKGKTAFNEGKSALKTGLFKWSPSWDEAGLKFEKAAKLFKEAGNEIAAKESYLEYARCLEKTNELLCAAEAQSDAAFLSKDAREAISLLRKADMNFKISGQSNRGVTLMKRYAQQQVDEETPEGDENALQVYTSLFEEIFNDDNYLLNGDMIDQYIKITCKKEQWLEVIKIKKRVQKRLRDTKTLDH